MKNNPILIAQKTLKKHPISSILWILAVPVGACFGLIYNIMNFYFEQVEVDISNGYFYTVAISIMLSIVFDLAYNVVKKENKEIRRIKVVLLIISYKYLNPIIIMSVL